MKFAKRWNYLQHQLWSGCDSGRVDRGRNVVRIPQKLEAQVYFFLAFQRFYSDLSWLQFPLFSEPDQTGRHLKPQSHLVELDWVDNWCLEKNIRNNFTWRWVFLYMSFYMSQAKVMKESFTFYQNPQSKHWFDVVYQNRPFDVVCTFWSEPYFEENL